MLTVSSNMAYHSYVSNFFVSFSNNSLKKKTSKFLITTDFELKRRALFASVSVVYMQCSLPC